jgi:Leucine-rich repeat (LRR) protein
MILNFEFLDVIQRLNFTNNNLTGNIPVDLGRLEQMQELDLSRNLLNGTIPVGLFTNCVNLLFWNVSSNKLTGRLPGEIGACTNLRIVDVGNNSLAGEIPPAMGQLGLLEELIMADNNGFNGSIPEAILSNCQNLVSLDIAWNSFSGPLPPQLGDCRNLEMLILQGNQFSGSVPGEFGKLQKLKLLALGNNNLTETLPESLTNCSALELLDVGNNQVTGPVPTWLGQLPNLMFITFQLNRFFGTIPVEVTTLPLLRYLDLSENLIQGSVLPEFGRVASLKMLRLSGNNLTGAIPAELGNITYLQGLDLSSNWLTGPIPSSLGNLRDLLWLQLGNNTLTGTIPPELTNCSSLLWINLAKNELEGAIPADFSTMGWDAGRVFSQNQETPWILDGVGECSIVSTWSPGQSQIFDTLLGMADPQKCHSWLPLLVRGALTFRSNSFTGESEVLSYWQLGKNDLTGPIPSFNYSTSTSTLGFLILSENHLTGAIPPELGNQPLYNLNVSRNRLTGPVPPTLGNASLLVTLDMAYNNLSGPLPAELGELNALTVLNVSYNTLLSGTIPSKGQFTTLGWTPYVGDINLCFNDSDPILKNILDHAHWTNGSTNMPLLCSQVKPSSLVTTGGTDKSKPDRRKRIMKSMTITFLSSLSTLTALLIICTCYCTVMNWRKRVAMGVYLEDGTGKPEALESRSSRSLRVASFGTPWLESLTYAHLLLATENFSPGNIVGDGGFGIVYKARLANGWIVAIKKLVQNGAQGPREFQAEMETLGMIQHENLVSLLGYCCSEDEMLLVYEFFVNGSLDDWLYESEEKAARLGWALRLRIALETARGLAFLHHECVHLIIHRDMKSSNILLNEHFKAVLTDFGMARIMDMDCSHVSTVVAGTPGYVPPEYSQTWRATTKGDVYSFGVVMLELLSGKRPTGPHFNGRCGSNLIEMTRILVSSGRFNELLDQTVLETGADQQISMFLDLALRCTEATPAPRPSMLEVVKTLESISAMQVFDRTAAVLSKEAEVV